MCCVGGAGGEVLRPGASDFGAGQTLTLKFDLLRRAAPNTLRNPVPVSVVMCTAFKHLCKSSHERYRQLP